jgi:pimeloyl-ACP methyl ester carboxylesterase
MSERRVETNGLSFRVLEDGDPDGPPVMLLHGFPDSADLWRHQVSALVAAGYHTIAPDLRGFGESDRPEGVDHYTIPVLMEDVRGWLDAFGIDRVRLVVHDWGAVLGWLFAASHPERVDRMATISVGYQSRRPSAEEAQAYWYIFLWQFEFAEHLLSRNGWKLMREWLREGRPGATPDIERNIADLSRPGALTAGLSYYRAIAQPQVVMEDELPVPPVECPVLAVWGEHDILPESRMTVSEENVLGPWRYERLDGLGHWLMLEDPERLNALLLDFLA